MISNMTSTFASLTSCRRLRKRLSVRGSAAGTATVEFALVVPLLLTLLLGIAEFGLLFEDFLILRNAVRAGARTGAVGASTVTIAADVIQASTGHEAESLTITQQFGTYSGASWSWQPLDDESTPQGVVNNAPSGSYVKVSVGYPHALLAASLIPGLEDEPGSGTITITADAVFRRE